MRIDQEYERFMMELEDLKLCIKRVSLSKLMRQLSVLRLKFDTSVYMVMLTKILAMLD